MNVDTYTESITYSLDIGSTTYSVSSGTGGSKETVATLLRDEINNDASAIVTASLVGDNETIFIETKSSAFDTTSISSEMSFWTYIISQSVVKDAIPAVQGDITVIETPVTGLDFVNNFISGTVGRDQETDSEARI